MSCGSRLSAAGLVVLLMLAGAASPRARLAPPTAVDASIFNELAWRPVGPFLGGRTTAGSGVPGNPHVFYIGVDHGGVWKSTDAGSTWQPVLDREPTGAIGSIAVAPSAPDVVYVGSEGGIYKSVNAGRAWTRLTFPAGNEIARIAIDPANANVFFAAVAGHAYGANSDRGIFRSTDGGQSIARVLFQNDDTGGTNVVIDASNHTTIFATLSVRRRIPWQPDALTGAGGGVFTSTDDGTTWQTIDRLPAGVDPGQPRAIAAGLLDQNGDRSRDRVWIDPTNADVRLSTGARGASVTVNGGVSWSSTANQPTSDVLHLNIDTAFPYRLCGTLESRGVVCVPSRARDGQLTGRDADVINADDTAFAATDPNEPDIVYDGRVLRYDRRTRETTDITPPDPAAARAGTLAPLLFSPTDSHTLFFATNSLWQTTTAGQTWTYASPDLSRETWDVPASVGTFRANLAAAPRRLGTIDAVTPSAIDAHVIWAGTDDGQIDVTRTGGTTWTNVTPASLLPWARVAALEASHFDVNTAYAAVNAQALDDERPHLLRTRDGGTTWTETVTGLPPRGAIHVVREDPYRRGLLFAGTDEGVYLSFDDGDVWQALTLNLPVTSVRDIAIGETDVAIATYGRGIWILDDFTPLREVTGDIVRASAFLFRPATAMRARWRQGDAPQDEPSAPNPHDGVALTYALGPGAQGPLSLEIINSPTGDVLRRYTSVDSASASSDTLATTPGVHRIFWDLRYVPPPHGASGAAGASPADPPRAPPGAFVPPGVYQLRLTVGGRALRQAVIVRMDPNVRVPDADLARQFALSKSLVLAIATAADTRQSLAGTRASPNGESGASATAGADLPSLDAAIARLSSVLQRIERADGRPTPAIEREAEAALAAATALVPASK